MLQTLMMSRNLPESDYQRLLLQVMRLVYLDGVREGAKLKPAQVNEQFYQTLSQNYVIEKEQEYGATNHS